MGIAYPLRISGPNVNQISPRAKNREAYPAIKSTPLHQNRNKKMKQHHPVILKYDCEDMVRVILDLWNVPRDSSYRNLMSLGYMYEIDPRAALVAYLDALSGRSPIVKSKVYYALREDY